MKLLDVEFDDTTIKISHPEKGSCGVDLFDANFADSFKSSSVEAGMVPPGLLYTNELNTVVIFERPPTYKQIGYSAAKKYNAKEHDLYTFPIPWQIYIGEYHPNGNLNSLAMFYADSEVEDLDVEPTHVSIVLRSGKPVMVPALTNIYEQGYICLDQTIALSDHLSLETRIASIHSLVWESVFNLDLTWALDQTIGTLRQHHRDVIKNWGPGIEQYTSYFEWAETLTIPDVVYGINGRPLYSTRSNTYKLGLDHTFNTQMYNNLFGVVPLLIV